MSYWLIIRLWTYLVGIHFRWSPSFYIQKQYFPFRQKEQKLILKCVDIFADDVIETANHFRCIDMIIDHAKAALTEKLIKELHMVLKNGTRETALPEEVADKMKVLLTEYNAKGEKTFKDILDFHVKFERIHPFQDGNGRVGRLIMFKECLKYNIVPFIIEDNLKIFYYRGLKEWDNEKAI